MKYLLYRSDQKVDMLLPQIPASARKEMEAGFEINFGVFKGSYKLKQHTLDEPTKRLLALVHYIKGFETVGSVDAPESWVSGVHEVSFVNVENNDQLVFFAGSSLKSEFLLGGAAHHLVSRSPTENIKIGWSFLPDLLRGLSLAFKDESRHGIEVSPESIGDRTEWWDLVNTAQKFVSGPHMKVEFLSKKLLYGQHLPNRPHALLATPLYVALTD